MFSLSLTRGWQQSLLSGEWMEVITRNQTYCSPDKWPIFQQFPIFMKLPYAVWFPCSAAPVVSVAFYHLSSDRECFPPLFASTACKHTQKPSLTNVFLHHWESACTHSRCWMVYGGGISYFWSWRLFSFVQMVVIRFSRSLWEVSSCCFREWIWKDRNRFWHHVIGNKDRWPNSYGGHFAQSGNRLKCFLYCTQQC